MSDQHTIEAVEKAIDVLWSIDLDKVRDAIREKLMAEVRDEVRQELIDEIREELDSAADAAEAEDAPEIGTESAWGQDEAAGLRAFLRVFDLNW